MRLPNPEAEAMNIRPLYDRVLLRRKEAAQITAGGLFVPEGAREKSHLAEVIAAGQGRLTDDGSVHSLHVEPGMTVLLGKWAGDEVELDGEKLLIVRESDILAVAM
jgi:chaperonin GroES